MIEAFEKGKSTIGIKQSTKALNEDQVKALYIAKDAEVQLIEKVKELADQKKVEVIYVDSMKKLGKVCGIDVGAAVAAVLK